jgi:hypothetical protein
MMLYPYMKGLGMIFCPSFERDAVWYFIHWGRGYCVADVSGQRDACTPVCTQERGLNPSRDEKGHCHKIKSYWREIKRHLRAISLQGRFNEGDPFHRDALWGMRFFCLRVVNLIFALLSCMGWLVPFWTHFTLRTSPFTADISSIIDHVKIHNFMLVFH